MSSRRAKAYLFLLGATLIWSIAGPTTKFTLGGLDPVPFLAYRFAVSGLIGLLFLLYKRPPVPKKSSDLLLLSLAAVLGTSVSLTLLFVGLDSTTVLDTTLIGAAGPLLIAAGGAIFFKDHITSRERFGIGVAVAGVLTTVVAPILFNGADTKFTGNVLIFLFLLVDTSTVLMVKKLLKDKVAGPTIVTFSFVARAVTFIPFAIAIVGFSELVLIFQNLELQYHLGALYMAIFSSIVAYSFYARGIRSIEISEASLFTYLGPIVSTPLAVVWLGETISSSFIIGAIIIATGVTLAEYKPQK